MPAPKKGLKFEKALEELERVVARLEKGNLPLEESLQLFEQGIKAARECRAYLEEAEKRVEMLLGSEAGELELSPYASEEDEDENETEDRDK
ncbi:MAG: exodeoxyribonuclease VII small subunit [Deltaproteobacteria bacterium RBG_13_61_14]|nr:MAG: exodeoxyribonuclease VII small subunit [Deltaproteobacteria bacterium RBG_13_61_14]